MNETIKTVRTFIGGALLALLILWAISPNEPDEINWSQLSGAGIITKMETATEEQVADYIQWISEEPWPAGFVIPAYVANARNENAAIGAVNNQYPEFSGKSDDDLLYSVRQHPLRYRDYMRELKAVERIFEVRQPS